MSIKRLPFEEFKTIYSKVPRLCVDIVVKKDDGIILSLREIPPGIGKWHLPGGTVLLGESIEEAISRVILDEMSIKVKINKLLGYCEYFKDKGYKNEAKPLCYANEAYGQTVSLVFLTEYVSGEFKGSDQAKNIQVFKELPENIIEEQRDFIHSCL